MQARRSEAQVRGRGGEQPVEHITFGAVEIVAAQSEVPFEVAGVRFDRPRDGGTVGGLFYAQRYWRWVLVCSE